MLFNRLHLHFQLQKAIKNHLVKRRLTQNVYGKVQRNFQREN